MRVYEVAGVVTADEAVLTLVQSWRCGCQCARCTWETMRAIGALADEACTRKQQRRADCWN